MKISIPKYRDKIL